MQFWAPSQVTVKSWADCNDDDDDYPATTPPPAEDDSPELLLADPDSRLSQEEVRSSSSRKPPQKKVSGTWIRYEFESCAKNKIVSSGIDDEMDVQSHLNCISSKFLRQNFLVKSKITLQLVSCRSCSIRSESRQIGTTDLCSFFSYFSCRFEDH